MQYYQDTIRSQNGVGVGYGYCLVQQGGVNSTIYDIDGVAIANPVRADGIGRYAFKAANGTYDLTFSGPNIITYTNEEVILFDPADDGAANIEFTPAGTGAVSTTVQAKIQQLPGTPYDRGAVADGTTDDAPEINTQAANAYSTNIPDGTWQIGSNISLTVPKMFKGNGAKTLFRTTVGFGATPIFTISPPASTDPKNWEIGNFGVTNQGSATSVFKIDLDAANKYVSKLNLSQVISNTAVSSGKFVELSNSIPNADGLFTSVFEDNWSFGGYYMDNVGDSLVFARNTTTGAGVGYYFNQLGTAANIVIRDGNCTSTGGLCSVVKGANIMIDNMQSECPDPFTGVNDAMVSIDHSGGNLVFNTKIVNSNINTQGNPLRCIYLQETDLAFIEGNMLYCDSATGTHIYIDTGARNTVVGNNKYYRYDTGAEVNPIIVDNGVGTIGVWKDATLTLAGWTNQNTANEHPSGYFKDRDGNVVLRGRVAGAATAGGETLFTLPVGFRPKTKAYLIGTFGSGGSNAAVLQIISTGAVQILTAGVTGVYLSGVVFSTR